MFTILNLNRKNNSIFKTQQCIGNYCVKNNTIQPDITSSFPSDSYSPYNCIHCIFIVYVYSYSWALFNAEKVPTVRVLINGRKFCSNVVVLNHIEWLISIPFQVFQLAEIFISVQLIWTIQVLAISRRQGVTIWVNDIMFIHKTLYIAIKLPYKYTQLFTLD